MTTRNDLLSKLAHRPLRHLPGLGRPSVLVGALLCLGTCNQNSGGRSEVLVPQASTASAKPSQTTSKTPKIKFNGGYNTATTPDALGNKTGQPNLLKGHTWITKKAMELLDKRGILPAVLVPDRYKNFLYYGTTFADWAWMGRPEDPDAPVWSPVVRSLNAADDLYEGAAASTPSCPYNSNCAEAELNSLCATFRQDGFYSYPCPCSEGAPNSPICDACTFSASDQQFKSNHFKRGWLADNFGKIASASCTNFYDQPCVTLPQSWANKEAPSPYVYALPGSDHTFDCLRGGTVTSKPVAHQPCMNIASAAYRKEDADYAYDIGINLNMNITAILGLGNAYQRDKAIQLFDASNSSIQNVYGERVAWASRNNEYDLQIMEANLPFHQNPAMLFRINLNLGGDGGWVGDFVSMITMGSIGNPEWNLNVQDFALDNLYHYSLSDILQFDSSVFGQAWGRPHDPTSADPGIAACNALAYVAGEYPPAAEYEWCMEDLSPYGTSVLAFPFRAADFADLVKSYPYLKREAFCQLNLQPAYGLSPELKSASGSKGYGAAKYGSVLYQFARKFFEGSPSKPTMADMIKAGNDVPGWETGGTYGAKSVIGGADFTSARLEFPHTYLGGNPFICSGGTTAEDSTDSCAKGDPTWPIWVPDDYNANDKDGFLDKLKAQTPDQSNRAALIYLGWTSHLMQDLALPHHASNWSGLRHAAQDSYGDMFALADAVQSGEPVVVSKGDACSAFNNVAHDDVPNNINDDNLAWLKVAWYQFGQEMDDLVTQMIGNSGAVNWTSNDIDFFCQATGLPRSGISDTDINWQAVYTAFLKQGQTAFVSRQMGTDDKCSPYLVGYPYPRGIIENAILATMKLILCAAPYDAEPVPAPEQLRAIPVDSGADLAWEPVTGATGYVVYVALGSSDEYTVLGEVTDPDMLTARNLTNGTNYSFYVTAKDANGIESGKSNAYATVPKSASSACTSAPRLWAEPSNESVVLDWTPMPEIATRYHVFMTVNDDPTIVDLGYSVTPTFTMSFTGYDGHNFWVQGENSDCKTPTSNIVSTTWGMGRLPAPMNFAATSLDHGADLYWDSVENAAGYVVFMAMDDSKVFTELGSTTGKDATSFLASYFHGFLNGRKCSFFVAATTAYGVLGYRSDTQSTVFGTGSQPGSTYLWAQPGDGEVTLRWLTLSSEAAYYNLWMKTDLNADYTSTACWTRNTVCTVPGLTNGTTYYFAVEGANNDYPSGNPRSNTVPVSPNMAVLPAPSAHATPVTGYADHGNIDLTWDPVPGATRYIVYQDRAASGPSDYRPVDFIDPVPANQVNLFSVGSMDYGTSYNFAVAALDANSVEGTRCWPVTATAAQSPALVAPSVTAEPGNSQVTLSWTLVPGASFYTVWMKTDPNADFTNDAVLQSWTLQTPDAYKVLDALTNDVTYYFWVQAGNTWVQANADRVPISTVVSATPQLPCPGGPTCSGHGTCNAGVCSCTPGSGYSGPDCSVTCPGGPMCSGHGTCNAGVCGCTPGSGYSGPDCSVTCPGGPTCAGHGTCDAGVCSCTPGSGYSGPDCSVTCPGGPTCAGHGTCSAGTCKCAVGYSGSSCSTNCGASSSCPNGTACGTNNSFCTTRSCVDGVCKAPSCAPHCSTGTACGATTDCGSQVCKNGTCQAPSCSPNCSQGSICGANPECSARLCSNGACVAPACAPHCNQGAACGASTDCGSGLCGSGTCQIPTCSPLCSTGAHCGTNADCSSKLCTNNICVAPTCSPRCSPGSSCGVGGDCLSRVCTGGTCRAPVCSPTCAKGTACGANTDCTSRVCSNGICG